MSSSQLLDSRQTIQLIHLGGSTKTVEVLRAQRVMKLELRWDLAGVYVLDLKLNQLKDSRLRRKGQSCWRAVDIEACKKLYWNLTNPKVETAPIGPTLHKVRMAEEASLKANKFCDCPPRKFCSICKEMKRLI